LGLRWLVAVVVAVGLATLVPNVALAPNVAFAQGTIEVLDISTSFDFPKAITFHLAAFSPSPIVKAELRYRTPHLSCGALVATAQPQFEPGTSVELAWEWMLLERGGLPVGATVTYQWIIEDEAGHVTRAPETTFVFDDPRFQWRSLRGEHVTIHWYQGGSAFAQNLLDVAEQGIARLHQSTGILPFRQVQVYVYGSSAAMREALTFPQEWTGGVSFSDYGLVSIGINQGNLDWGQRAMVHEMTHVVVYEATLSCGSDLPTWIHEGLAVMNEGPLQSYYQRALDQAIAAERTLAVRSIAGDFPAAQDEAILAYAQSWSLVSYLTGLRGPQGLADLFSAFQETGSIDRALEQVFGFGQEGLNRRWRDSVGLPALEPLSTPTLRVRPLPTIEPYSSPPAPPQVGEEVPAVASAPIATVPSAATPTAAPTVRAEGGSGCNRASRGSGIDVTGLVAVLGLGLAASRRRTVHRCEGAAPRQGGHSVDPLAKQGADVP
jgi:hypothetical protein